MIVIIDYGMGNLGSIHNMLRKIGSDSRISAQISDIESAEKLILPGVGSFDNAMRNLQNLDLIPILNKKVMQEKTPVLGICLGIQIFTRGSEEGSFPGLGWVDAETIRFRFNEPQRNLKIPHMGWNSVEIKKEDALFNNMVQDPRFYFVHSFHIMCNNPDNILTTTHYGYDFISSLQKENIYGTQFHPEKSHKYGMKIFKNFVELS